MESNDSPEIPDRGETSDIPGLPSGAHKWNFTFKNNLKSLSDLCKKAWYKQIHDKNVHGKKVNINHNTQGLFFSAGESETV